MKEIVKPLLTWFELNKRSLEWRENPTAYTILISEVMLQQTRAEAVRPYYVRFLEELPSFKALSECPDEKLFKLWEGLGYYNRARNLKKCAIKVVEEHQQIFPKDYEQAIALPGIGAYTCGAILSRTYNLPYAAVDGNVLRVLSRYLCSEMDILKDTTKKYFKDELEKIIPSEAGMFNEALMELGATVCMPKVYLCSACPLQENCQARKTNTQALFPKKELKKEKKIFEYTVLFLTDGVKYAMFSKKDGVLKELPSPILVEAFLTSYEALEYVSSLGFDPIREVRLEDKVHIFTHQKWFMQGYKVYVRNLLDAPSYTAEEIKNRLGVPTCFKQFLTEVLS